jgi:hypothetical protein
MHWTLHGVIDLKNTIVAGHSMGGAIALRVGAKVPVAGIIALSPAPMRPSGLVTPSMLLYTNPPPVPAHTLLLSGGWEPRALRRLTAELLDADHSATSTCLVAPHATHGGLIFDSFAARATQNWTQQVLHLDTAARAPSRLPLVGFAAGFAGLLLLAGPFVREVFRSGSVEEAEQRLSTPQRQEASSGLGLWRAMAITAVAACAAVFLLTAGVPLRFLKLYQGAYLASFLLLAGIAAGALVWAVRGKAPRASARWKTTGRLILPALFAGLVLQLLFSAWLELTLSEAWLDVVRWERFPFVFLAGLAWHWAEEELVGAPRTGHAIQRILFALLLRALLWLALAAGVLLSHNGEVLMVLLVLQFAAFSVLQRAGMNVVRTEARSVLSAAVFGAILTAGFVLALFPLA